MNTVMQGYHRMCRLTVLACSILLLSGCDRRQPNDYASATSAVYAMFNAFYNVTGDPDAAWAFLGPETQGRLEQLAATGPDGLRPTDFLRFGWLPDEALIRSMEPIERSSTHTRFLIETELDDRFELEMVRVQDGWRVELGGVASAAEDQDEQPVDSEDR